MITKYYFINKFETNNIDRLDKQSAVIYRNYNSKVLDKELILKFKRYCKKNGIQFYLSNNIKLAIKLDLDGAYIPSFYKGTSHLSYSYKKNFLLIGSAHNNNEIRTKELQNVSVIFLSSIFKNNKNYLGVNKFKLLSKLSNRKIVALGGVSKKNQMKLALLDCFGFAGISYFQ